MHICIYSSFRCVYMHTVVWGVAFWLCFFFLRKLEVFNIRTMSPNTQILSTHFKILSVFLSCILCGQRQSCWQILWLRKEPIFFIFLCYPGSFLTGRAEFTGFHWSKSMHLISIQTKTLFVKLLQVMTHTWSELSKYIW